MNKKYCVQCGKELKKKTSKMLCDKHLNEYNKYGFCISDTQRDENDRNEIIVHEDYAEIVLYDNYFNELEDKVVIDLEDVDIVKKMFWKRHGNSIIGFSNQYTHYLPNLIMDIDNKIEYLDGNIFNNRKANLDIVKNKKFKHHFANNKKYKNKIVITSLGGSTEDVTGSCIAIDYPLDNGNRDLVLIECGSIQTNRIKEDYLSNKKMVDGIPYNLASAIFVCHSHADHIGNIPAGITRGFSGKVITTYENEQIMKPMLLDASFIHNRNVMGLNKKGSKYEVLYDESDVYTILSRIQLAEKNEIQKVNSNLSFRFTNNNHCIGSVQLELMIKKPSGRVIKLFYSSDLGSRFNQKYKPYSDERKDVSKANVAIFESTYGLTERCFTKKDAEEEARGLIAKIKEVTGRGNRVLIPTFAFDRAQSIMTFLYDELKDDPQFKTKIIVDSRLLNDINNVCRNIFQGERLDKWNEVMAWDKFLFVSEFKKTEIFASDKDNPYVYLSSSGMLSAGHSLTYAKSILPNRKDCMLFVGYNSPTTTGGKIQQGAKSVTIDGKSIPIRCEVCIFKTFTGHAQASELIAYMKNIKCDKIYIHHGSSDAKDNLKFRAEEEFLFSDMTKKISIIDKKNNQIII